MIGLEHVVAARFTECAAKRVHCVALGNFRTKLEWFHLIDWLCTTAAFQLKHKFTKVVMVLNCLN